MKKKVIITKQKGRVRYDEETFKGIWIDRRKVERSGRVEVRKSGAVYFVYEEKGKVTHKYVGWVDQIYPG